MAKAFEATSTTEDVLSGIDLRGKRVLVTGVSAGLGVETARSLAAHAAKVIGTARDLAKAEAATAQIRKDAAANGGSFELVELDRVVGFTRPTFHWTIEKHGLARAWHQLWSADT